MKILAIDTSCDETAAAVTEGHRILSNVLYSQVLLHKNWGGVMPHVAKRAHEEHIKPIVNEALRSARIDIEDIGVIAVTYGPGLAIALGVGIDFAKELALEHNKPLVAVNHMEGHIYSCFAQNSQGKPEIKMEFPYIVLLVSGAHTEIVLFTDHRKYEVIGQTVDDAAGEALDKAARQIIDDVIYPGGPVVEELARSGDPHFVEFPRPMQYSKDLQFSFSGLKTALLREVHGMSQQKRILHMPDLAASFQEAVFDSLLIKLEMAMKAHNVNRVVIGGGVSANRYLRKKVRGLVKQYGGCVRFPLNKKLEGDNAAMIGIAAHYHALKQDFIKPEHLQRSARASL